jgi:hypothetical protein
VVHFEEWPAIVGGKRRSIGARFTGSVRGSQNPSSWTGTCARVRRKGLNLTHGNRLTACGPCTVARDKSTLSQCCNSPEAWFLITTSYVPGLQHVTADKTTQELPLWLNRSYRFRLTAQLNKLRMRPRHCG